MNGDVLVNSGSGFQKVTGTGLNQINAPAGSRVMIGPKGSAVITYASNCSVRVPSGLWAVQDKAPCPQGVAMLDLTNRMNQSAPPTDDDDDNTGAWLLGGLLVGGGIAGAIILLDDDNKKDVPLSP